MTEEPDSPAILELRRLMVDGEYLGDGVYVRYMGYGNVINLDLRGQPPTIPITQILLEDEVLNRLDSFRTRLTELVKAAHREREAG